MTALQVVLLVVGILAVIAVAVYFVGRASKEVARDLARELERSGERAVLAPEPALYSGASARYSKMRGNCVLALTEKRLLVRMLVGTDIELERSEIVGAHDAKTFDGHYQGSRYLVIDLKDGTEVGFLVRDMAPWKAALGESPSKAET